MIQGCLDNVAAAQEVLYSRFSPRMLGVCYRFARNREDAEDMMQEGFIKVFSQIHQFRGQGALEGWIRRIIVHTCINILKKNKKFSDSVDLFHANSIYNIVLYLLVSFSCLLPGDQLRFSCMGLRPL